MTFQVIPGLGKLQLVKSHEVTVACTSFDVEGLDINSCNGYLLILDIKNDEATARGIRLYVDDGSGTLDTTDTNYYTQYFTADGAGVTGSRANQPDGFVIDASTWSSNLCWLFRDGGGYTRWISYTNMGAAAAVEFRQFCGAKTATNTNITKIRVKHITADKIGVGTTLKIYSLVN